MKRSGATDMRVSRLNVGARNCERLATTAGNTPISGGTSKVGAGTVTAIGTIMTMTMIGTTIAITTREKVQPNK
jgi:hypothetical protein